MSTATEHPLQARKVRFDLSASPIHWLGDDLFSSHIINGIHLLLPAGELWFCRLYNKALPQVRDARLAADVRGFIHQEGVHAQAHRHGEAWLRAHGYDVDAYRERIDWLFETFLGDAPLGIPALQRKSLQQPWLLARLGVVATIEHFTGLLGDWCLNSKGWDHGDAVVADLFRWHLAEEVEHRTVAYDLFEHLLDNRPGFYLSRQALMAVVFPLFIYFIGEAGRVLAAQDPDPRARHLARASLPRILWQLQKVGKQTDNVPTFGFIVERALRWMVPGFHPITEGDTRQALDYIARSPAAQAVA